MKTVVRSFVYLLLLLHCIYSYMICILCNKLSLTYSLSSSSSSSVFSTVSSASSSMALPRQTDWKYSLLEPFTGIGLIFDKSSRYHRFRKDIIVIKISIISGSRYSSICNSELSQHKEQSLYVWIYFRYKYSANRFNSEKGQPDRLLIIPYLPTNQSILSWHQTSVLIHCSISHLPIRGKFVNDNNTERQVYEWQSDVM